MIDTVKGRNRSEVVGVHSFKTADVVSILVGIGPTLMMCVDPAVGAEVVLGGFGIELVHLQVIFTLQNPHAG